MVRPGECGTFRPPPDDSPDREAVDRFREFLADVDRRGIAAVSADPAWRSYVGGAPDRAPDVGARPVQARPRGRCPGCYRTRALKRDPADPARLVLPDHDWPQADQGPCDGSGHEPMREG